MSDKLKKLKKMRAEVRKYEDTVRYYEKLYAEDGEIDEFEQEQLDNIKALIEKIKPTIEQRIQELSPTEKAENEALAQEEATKDEQSTEDDIVDHSLVKEKPLTATGELNTDTQLYSYWQYYKKLIGQWNKDWSKTIKEHTTAKKPFSLEYLEQLILFLEKMKMAGENYLHKFEELEAKLSSAMRPNSEKRKQAITESLPKWTEYLQQFTDKKNKELAQKKLLTLCNEKITKLNEYVAIWREEVFPNIKALLVTKENLLSVQEMYDHILEMRTFFGNLPKEYQEVFKDSITVIHKDIWKERLDMAKLKFQDSEKKKNPVQRTDGNPNLPKDKEKTLQYEKPKKSAQLYETGNKDSHKIDDNDLQQEELDNCFALSAIASIANTDPQLIEDIIEEKSDGSFEVTLYPRLDPKSEKRTKTIIAVRREFLAAKGNGGASVGKGDFRELWPKVLDKALAQLFGGYDVLDNRGYPEEILQVLTGKSVTKTKVDSQNKEELLVIFEQAIKDKKAVTIGSIKSPDGKEFSENADNQILYYSHTYYLEKVSSSKIELKNPHGEYHLKLSWDTFIQFFSHYSKLD